MIKSKTLMILLVLVMLAAVVGLSGCVSNDSNNTTNTTPPENNTTNTTPPDNNTTNTTPPENNTTNTTPPGNNSTNTTPPANSVTVLEYFDGPANHFVQARDQVFVTKSLNIKTGETVRIRNMNGPTDFAHLYVSTEGAFDPVKCTRNVDRYFTFNSPGVYRIELWNPETNETFKGSVLTVTVTN
jgi:plastocyanin